MHVVRGGFRYWQTVSKGSPAEIFSPQFNKMEWFQVNSVNLNDKIYQKRNPCECTMSESSDQSGGFMIDLAMKFVRLRPPPSATHGT